MYIKIYKHAIEFLLLFGPRIYPYVKCGLNWSHNISEKRYKIRMKDDKELIDKFQGKNGQRKKYKFGE